jgi:hypothetical protein
MGSKLYKTLIVLVALVLFGLCTFASLNSELWETILAGSFDHCNVTQNTIDGEVGFFVLDDPFRIISHVRANLVDGYILFTDSEGDNPLGSRLTGFPITGFLEQQLLLEFEVTALQENSSLWAVLTDEDDLDVLLLSLGNNGNWFVNGLDTGFSYLADVNYIVSILLEVDSSSGLGLYSIYVEESGSSGGATLIDSGLAVNFHYGRLIDEMRIEKPGHSASGSFIIDDILLQRLSVEESSSWGRQKRP